MPRLARPSSSVLCAWGTFDVSNTASLVDAVTDTLDPDPLPGTLVRLVMSGQYLNNSGANRTLRLEVALGGVAVYTATTGNLGASASTRSFKAEVHLLVASTTSQRVLAEGVVAATATADGTATWASNNQRYLGERTTTVNMATAQDLVVRLQHSLAATTITMSGVYRVECIRPVG